MLFQLDLSSVNLKKIFVYQLCINNDFLFNRKHLQNIMLYVLKLYNKSVKWFNDII